MTFIDFIIQNIFRNPPVLLGLVAAFGLILQKKHFSDVIKGSFMAAMGMFILQQGVGLLATSIIPINSTFSSELGASVSKGLNDQTFTTSYGGQIGTAMVIGYALHIAIARFSPFKNIFLTGHFIWWMPFIFTAIAVESGLNGSSVIIFASVLSALYWSIMPHIMRPYVRDVIGNDSFTLGHPSSILALIAAHVARVVGDKSKSTEDLEIPQGLSFFREISITGGLTIFLMYLGVGIFVNGAFAKEGSLVFYALGQGFKFGSGLIILLTGVRMLIAQLIPSFKGIADKIVPNAIPALDCPMLFSYKPNAVIIGFLVAMVTSTILIIIVSYMNLFGIILIPLVVTSFFECGTAAVIAEGQGGLRGAIIGTMVAACFMVLFLGLSVGFYAHTIQNWIMIFGGNDLSAWAVTGVVAKMFGG